MVARLARVRRYGPDSCTNLFEKEIMANHSKVRTAAEAQFRKSLKATWKGKKVTTPYEAEARAARNKTARLKELRLAKEAAEKETKTSREQSASHGTPWRSRRGLCSQASQDRCRPAIAGSRRSQPPQDLLPKAISPTPLSSPAAVPAATARLT